VGSFSSPATLPSSFRQHEVLFLWWAGSVLGYVTIFGFSFEERIQRGEPFEVT
jgi:hypothetical protein